LEAALAIDLNSPSEASEAVRPVLVVGPENRLLLALLAAWAPHLLEGSDRDAGRWRMPAPLRPQFHPVLIAGPTGTGKSLVARALAGRTADRLRCSAREFAESFRQAIAEDQVARWREGVAACRMVVMEDLDRCRLGSAVQQELCRAIDALAASGGVLVATAAKTLSQWEGLSLALRDRLHAGLTVPLRAPSLAARLAILRQACREHGVDLSLDEATQIAEPPEMTPRALWGAAAEMQRTRQFVRGRETSTNDDPRRLKEIFAAAARYLGVSAAALAGPSRRSSLVRARGIAIRVARLTSGRSFAEIGRFLGGRDHTTVLHAERAIVARGAVDPTIQLAIEELSRIVRAI
jgi:chromosomal replication initiator protein